MEPNQSPVNFFEPDTNAHPKFSSANRVYNIFVEEGDCLYIPAFYFYQFVGKAKTQPRINGAKASAIFITLKYEPTSQLMKGFMKAIENGTLK
jgi:hypothetical protein